MAVRTCPIHRRRGTPTASWLRNAGHHFQRPGTLAAPRLPVTRRTTECLSDAVLGNGQQHGAGFQRPRQHGDRGMRHPRTDGRIGKPRKLLAVEPPDPRRTLLESCWQGLNRSAVPAHRRLGDMTAVSLPLAQRASRIAERDEHTVMCLGPQPQHAACIRVRRHAIRLLVGGIVDDDEHRVAVDRRIHGGTCANDAAHLPACDGKIGPVSLRRRHRSAEHGDISHVPALLRGTRTEEAQSKRPQLPHGIVHGTHGRHHRNDPATGGERTQHHPSEQQRPMPSPWHGVGHESAFAPCGQDLAKHPQVLVIR